MTYTQARIDAFAQLEQAIDNLREVMRREDPPEDPIDEILSGWVLVLSSIHFHLPETHNVNVDDSDTWGGGQLISRRGQDPTLTYGILNDGVRMWNQANVDE